MLMFPSDDPQLTVVKGSAIIGASLSAATVQSAKHIVLEDAIPLSFGFSVCLHGEQGRKGAHFGGGRVPFSAVLGGKLCEHNLADDGVKVDAAERRIALHSEHLTVDGAAAHIEREKQLEIVARRRRIETVRSRRRPGLNDQLTHAQIRPRARAARYETAQGST
jgi:hypothetical protein